MQSCFARSSGVIGRPFFSKYDGAATVSTRVSRSSRDDIVEGGCGPKRMDRSTPAVIRSPDFGVASQPVTISDQIWRSNEVFSLCYLYGEATAIITRAKTHYPMKDPTE